MAKSKTVVMAEQVDATEITLHEVMQSVPAVISLTPEAQAEQEVQKFDLPRAWIASKKEQYKDLKISGADDKAGYKKVEAAWQEVRGKRIATEKKREEIKSGYLFIGKKIDAHAKDLVSELREIEDPLNAELERIDNEKKLVEQQREREIQLALQNRVSELLENGMGFSGSYYTIGETISMDVVTLKGMKSDEYEAFLSRVKTTNRDILEAKRKKEQDEQDERDRLKEQQQNQEKERLRLKDLQDKIDEQNRAIKEKIVKLRSAQVTALGMKFDYNTKSFIYRDEYGGYVFIWLDFIETAADEPFEFELAEKAVQIDTAKKFAKVKADEAEETRKENERKSDKKKKLDARTMERERDIFELFGMRADGPLEYSIKSKLDSGKLSIQRASLIEKDGNDWAGLLNEVKKMFKKFQITEQRLQKEIDDARELKRLSKLGDGELIEDMLGRVCAPLVMQGAKPTFKTTEGEAIWQKFETGFNDLLKATHAAIDNLEK